MQQAMPSIIIIIIFFNYFYEEEEMPCRHHAELKTEKTLPTGGLLVLSRTQVHALGGLHVLELPLLLSRSLGLS